MTDRFSFTFGNLERQLSAVLGLGYRFITCEQYALTKDRPAEPTVVLRVDIDVSCRKARRLAEIFNRLGIKASFFVRLHAPEYNPFDFENYRVLKEIRDAGHELGYHSEVVDESAIWQEDAALCLRRDIEIMNRLFDIGIRGVASHRGMTGLNNLDFWKGRSPQEFGLLYEAYEESPGFNLFADSFYVSDSEWFQWKCYDKGTLVEGDRRSFAQHAKDAHPLLYLLLHPESYFDRHFYE